MPGHGAEALPVTGGPTGPAAHAAARAYRLAVAALEIGALHSPVSHCAEPWYGHHATPIAFLSVALHGRHAGNVQSGKQPGVPDGHDSYRHQRHAGHLAE